MEEGERYREKINLQRDLIIIYGHLSFICCGSSCLSSRTSLAVPIVSLEFTWKCFQHTFLFRIKTICKFGFEELKVHAANGRVNAKLRECSSCAIVFVFVYVN